MTMDANSEPPAPGPNGPLDRLLSRLRAPAVQGLRRFPWRAALLIALLLFGGLRGAAFVRKSFRAVAPGEAGIAVNRLTGSARVVPAGVHFLPASFTDLVAIRISDQLLSGPAATFAVTSKDGISVGLAVQARWAVDRAQLREKWAALPADPGRDIVAPVLASSFRSQAPSWEATALLAARRDELAAAAAKAAAPRLAEAGLVLKEVLVADVRLPAEYERGRMALLAESQRADEAEANLRLKRQEVERTRLEAEADKVRRETQAETQAAQRLIAAKAEADAMTFVLPLKQKEVRQRLLEAEADKGRRITEANAQAEASKIHAAAEAARKRTLADAEAYAIRTTSLAQFENLKREVELIQANPVWVEKTFAEKLSDKMQVLVMPSLPFDVFGAETAKRLANGRPVRPARGANEAAHD
jgi:regulator of protease activity HflC (stomatin/prohibitin superfamily)